MITKENIRQLLKRLEGEPAGNLEDETIEFKLWEPEIKNLHKLLREEAVCLANARGGTIILGIRDGAKTRREAIQGVGPCDLYGLRRAVYDGTDPHILVEIEELVEPEGKLLLIHIPKGIPPHTTSDGVSRIRIGKDCKPLTGGMLARLLASGGQRDFTAEIVTGMTLKDLQPTDLSYLHKILQQQSQNPKLADMEDAHLLEALGLLVKDEMTVAGLLLLGKPDALCQFIPQHEVIFLRYRSDTRYDQRKDMRGSLLSILQEMESLISVNNRIKTIQQKGFGQLELPDFSWEVSREAVLNAMTHRDYFIRQGIRVALMRGRLEVTSPGGFIGGVTPENILRHPPIHRNERLARVFQTIGLVNRVGLGVDRIYEGLLQLGKDLPRYSADESYVQLIIPLESHPEFALFLAEEHRKNRKLELDDLILLRKLISVSALDRWSAASILQLSEEEAANRLIKLREAGYLVVHGRGQGASYDLKRDIAIRFRGKSRVDAEIALDHEGIRLRILALLKNRGRLTNAEIRRFSGYSRIQVYRLVKELEKEGKIRFQGKGRSAFIKLADNK